MNRIIKNVTGLWAVQDNGTLWRFKWGELSLSKRIQFAFTYNSGAEHSSRCSFNVKIPCVSLFLYTPWNHVTKDAGFDAPQWGFYTMEDSLWLWWGKKYKVIYYPWSWHFIRHSQLMDDGTWYTYGKDERSWEKPVGVFTETHDYTYELNSGAVQKLEAKIYVEEREWRWRWFKQVPYPRKVLRSIDIQFSGEVGERAGSWKGGCIGCSYNIKKGETPLMTLRRMESEREFR